MKRYVPFILSTPDFVLDGMVADLNDLHTAQFTLSGNLDPGDSWVITSTQVHAFLGSSSIPTGSAVAGGENKIQIHYSSAKFDETGYSNVHLTVTGFDSTIIQPVNTTVNLDDDGYGIFYYNGVSVGNSPVTFTDEVGDESTTSIGVTSPQVESNVTSETQGATYGPDDTIPGFWFSCGPSLTAVPVDFTTDGSTLPASLMGDIASGSVSIPASDDGGSVFVPMEAPADNLISASRVAVVTLNVPGEPQGERARISVNDPTLPEIKIDGQETGADVDVDPENEDDPGLLVPISLSAKHYGDLTSTTFSWDPGQDIIWLSDEIGTVGVDDLGSLPSADGHVYNDHHIWDGTPPQTVYAQPIGGSPSVDGTDMTLEADDLVAASPVVPKATTSPMKTATVTQNGLEMSISSSDLVPDADKSVAGQVMIGAGIIVSVTYVGPSPSGWNGQLTNIKWTIDGANGGINDTAIGGYLPQYPGHQVDYLSASRLTDQSVGFIFLKDGPNASDLRKILVSARVMDKSYSVKTSLRVWNPTVTDGPIIKIGQPGVVGNKLGAVYPPIPIPFAIEFESAVTVPSQFQQGQWAYLQLIQFQAFGSGGGFLYKHTANTQGKMVLDTSFPIGIFPPTPTDGVQHSFEDGPYVPMNSAYLKTASCLFSLQTYLMFEPAGNSNWVPVEGKVWGFISGAAFDGTKYLSTFGAGVWFAAMEGVSAEPQWLTTFDSNGAWVPLDYTP